MAVSRCADGNTFSLRSFADSDNEAAVARRFVDARIHPLSEHLLRARFHETGLAIAALDRPAVPDLEATGERPRAMTAPALVAFTGVDGAGKTTQARPLTDRLREAGYVARYEHLTAPQFELTASVRSRCVEGLLAVERGLTSRTAAGCAGPGLSMPLGALSLARGLWRSWLNPTKNRGADVVVLDRYLYDDLARATWRYGYDPATLVSLTRLVPAPDVVVYLDLDGETAWARETDGTTSVTTHVHKKACYDRVVDTVDDRTPLVTVPTANTDAATTVDRLSTLLSAHL